MPRNGSETISRRVVVFTALNQFADLYGPLARILRAEHGVDSVLIHLGRHALPDPDVYDFRRDDFVEIIDFERHVVPRKKAEIPNAGALAEACRKFERDTGAHVLDILRTDRHLGRSFVTGASFPRSRYSTSTDFDQSLDIILCVAEQATALFDRLRPIAFVTTATDVYRATLWAVAEAKGIPRRALTRSFSQKGLYLTDNRYFTPIGLARSFQIALAAEELDPERSEDEACAGELSVQEIERTHFARAGLRKAVQPEALLRQIYGAVRSELGRRIKRSDNVYGNYLLGDTLAHIHAVWREKRRALRIGPVFSSLEAGLPFVFYPLTVEPESTLMAESPMCDNQLTIIDWLAKTTPAGWRLVVKEHPGFTSPRPAGFWERIRSYPNVLVAAPFESGEALAARARVVAVVSGTLGIQSACAGIPVLSFHPAYYGHLLPHVRFADSYETTRTALNALAASEALPPMAERRRHGRALLKALDAGAIPVTDRNLLRGVAGGEKIADETVAKIAEKLLASLAPAEEVEALVRPLSARQAGKP